jgi:hypothetical protein
MKDTSTQTQESQKSHDFESWADERAREYDELAADRFACGGWRCDGAHNEL